MSTAYAKLEAGRGRALWLRGRAENLRFEATCHEHDAHTLEGGTPSSERIASMLRRNARELRTTAIACDELANALDPKS